LALIDLKDETFDGTFPFVPHYRAPYPTPEMRRALLCWSRDIPVAEGDPSYADLKWIEDRLPQFAGTPMLLIWGMRDPVLSEPVLRQWQHIFPQATCFEIDDASHFLQEDTPERIVSRIKDFLDAHP
jgi:cis-3-alkyl-4-acyloxetan-2-one decarboxylase